MEKTVTIRDKEGNIEKYNISPVFVKKYGENGALIYTKSMDSKYEEWRDYDEFGNLIHLVSNGDERWWDYDKYGNIIHTLDNKGNEEKMRYDKYGNKTYEKTTSFPYEQFWKYDRHGNLLKYSMSNGYKEWMRYDRYGKVIYYKNSMKEVFHEYDRFGNIIYEKVYFGEGSNFNYEVWNEYNNKGEMVFHRGLDNEKEQITKYENGHPVFNMVIPRK